MFQSARIKLTIWYMLITLLVSIFFSLGIFTILHRELVLDERRFEGRMRLLEQANPGFLPDFTEHQRDIEYTEQQILLNLLYINVLVLAISALAGYILAGRTLNPIKVMVDKQNEFITNASHELRTPLTALKTAIEVNLRDKNIDLKQAKNVLKDNLFDIDRLKTLSDSLLSLAKLQSSLPQKKEAVELSNLISTVIEQISSLAYDKNITIETHLKEMQIQADAERLQEMFVIFIDNAIKYSPDKTTIQIKSTKRDNRAVVTIKDEGMGIDKKDIPHIFERFYRADFSRSHNKVEGYGLGLAIAKEILDVHNGHVHVESKIGKGTVFTISLPLNQ